MLAQSTPSTAAEESGDTLLVVFPLAAPERLDEDIAKEHKLEFVRHFTIDALNARFVVYRVIDGRPVAEAVVALKADQRVSRAHANLRYIPATQAPAGR